MGKIEHEKKTVGLMISIYCRAKHSPRELCDDCKELLNYAHARLDSCPHAPDKESCKHCSKHCYSKAMREKIRVVMRFSGPRMLLRAPLSAIRHFLSI